MRGLILNLILFFFIFSTNNIFAQDENKTGQVAKEIIDEVVDPEKYLEQQKTRADGTIVDPGKYLSNQLEATWDKITAEPAHPYDGKPAPGSYTMLLSRVEFSKMADVKTYTTEPFAVDKDLHGAIAYKSKDLMTENNWPLNFFDISGLYLFPDTTVEAYNTTVSPPLTIDREGPYQYYMKGKMGPLGVGVKIDTQLISSETVTREIVIGKKKKVVNGQKVKVDEMGTTDVKIDTYSATLKSPFTFHAVIRDYKTDEIVFEKDIVHEYVWENKYIIYEGKKKALTKKEKKMARKEGKKAPAGKGISWKAYSGFLHAIGKEISDFLHSV